jgi:hypothetical protein
MPARRKRLQADQLLILKGLGSRGPTAKTLAAEARARARLVEKRTKARVEAYLKTRLNPALRRMKSQQAFLSANPNFPAQGSSSNATPGCSCAFLRP